MRMIQTESDDAGEKEDNYKSQPLENGANSTHRINGKAGI